MSGKKRVGVLISGRGSNLRALIEASRKEQYPARIVTVISNRPEAMGLDIARTEGLSTVTVDHKTFSSREAFDAALHGVLQDAGVDLICNAGFMRLLTAGFVDKWRDRQLNIHPSLLPAFKGLHTHERVIEAGVKITGCTVHFVRSQMDSGPVIAQAAVAVLPDDSPDRLAARVLKAEHKIYPQALALVASGALTVSGEQVLLTRADGRVQVNEDETLFSPPLQSDDIG